MLPEKKAALSAAAQKALARLAQNCPGLKWATVATKDGAEIATHGSSADEKLSVMTGTMHALADGIVGEAELNRVQFEQHGFWRRAAYSWGNRMDLHSDLPCCVLTMPGGAKHRRTCVGWRRTLRISAPASASWRSTKLLRRPAPRGLRRTQAVTRRP